MSLFYTVTAHCPACDAANTVELSASVNADRRPDLATRFRVDEVPTLLVVEDRKVQKRIVAPTGCRDLEAGLAAWLH